jgi:hypothetical protein
MGNSISYEIHRIVTCSMPVRTRDCGYAECEYCLLFQPLSHWSALSSETSEISNAECWSFTKFKFIKYVKMMWCGLLWLGPERNVHRIFMWLCGLLLKNWNKEDQLEMYADWIILLTASAAFKIPAPFKQLINYGKHVFWPGFIRTGAAICAWYSLLCPFQL